MVDYTAAAHTGQQQIRRLSVDFGYFSRVR
jgi:hypothetical protein